MTIAPTTMTATSRRFLKAASNLIFILPRIAGREARLPISFGLLLTLHMRRRQWATTLATTKSATITRMHASGSTEERAGDRAPINATLSAKGYVWSGRRLPPPSHQNITGSLSIAIVAAPWWTWTCALSRVIPKLQSALRCAMCNVRAAMAMDARALSRCHAIPPSDLTV